MLWQLCFTQYLYMVRRLTIGRLEERVDFDLMPD
jgi:hypothetical protein